MRASHSLRLGVILCFQSKEVLSIFSCKGIIMISVFGFFFKDI